MKLYGMSLSPFVRKVAAVIHLKNLECEREESLFGTLPRDLSPLGKIPAFVDGDLKLADSSVICEYLEEQYPAVPVLPRSIPDRARARWFEEFADTKLSALCGDGIFFERIAKKVLMGQDADEQKVSDTIDNLLPPVLDYLEGEMPKEGFLFGAPGIADISIVTHFVNAGYAGYQLDAARWPRLAAFVQRVSALPAMQRQFQGEAAVMAQMRGGK